MRLGIYGGTFDPIHYAHLLLAECCREQAGLDRVWFVPAAVSPWKQTQPPSDGKHRLEMLKLALGGYPAFQVYPGELERGGVSFTIDTLRAIHREQPDAELFLLLGGDAMHDLPQWREAQAICDLALPLAVARPGSPPPDFTAVAPLLGSERLLRSQQLVIQMPQMEISSSDIRRRVSLGHSLRFRVPAAVEAYIATHRLYQNQ